MGLYFLSGIVARNWLSIDREKDEHNSVKKTFYVLIVSGQNGSTRWAAVLQEDFDSWKIPVPSVTQQLLFIVDLTAKMKYSDTWVTIKVSDRGTFFLSQHRSSSREARTPDQWKGGRDSKYTHYATIRQWKGAKIQNVCKNLSEYGTQSTCKGAVLSNDLKLEDKHNIY